jgi:hypothetical protein
LLGIIRSIWLFLVVRRKNRLFLGLVLFLLPGTSNKYRRDEYGRVLRGLLIFIDFRGLLEVLS